MILYTIYEVTFVYLSLQLLSVSLIGLSYLDLFSPACHFTTVIFVLNATSG